MESGQLECNNLLYSNSKKAFACSANGRILIREMGIIHAIPARAIHHRDTGDLCFMCCTTNSESL